jgi:hypothetical protein
MRPSSPQDNGAALDPLIMMGTVEPKDVSTAEPVTVKLAASGAPGQVPEVVSVAVEPLAVNLILPGTVIGGPEAGVSVKVKSIVYEVVEVSAAASTVSVKPLQSAVAVAPVRWFARAGYAKTSKHSPTAKANRILFIWALRLR